MIRNTVSTLILLITFHYLFPGNESLIPSRLFIPNLSLSTSSSPATPDFPLALEPLSPPFTSQAGQERIASILAGLTHIQQQYHAHQALLQKRSDLLSSFNTNRANTSNSLQVISATVKTVQAIFKSHDSIASFRREQSEIYNRFNQRLSEAHLAHTSLDQSENDTSSGITFSPSIKKRLDASLKRTEDISNDIIEYTELLQRHVAGMEALKARQERLLFSQEELSEAVNEILHEIDSYDTITEFQQQLTELLDRFKHEITELNIDQPIYSASSSSQLVSPSPSPLHDDYTSSEESEEDESEYETDNKRARTKPLPLWESISKKLSDLPPENAIEKINEYIANYKKFQPDDELLKQLALLHLSHTRHSMKLYNQKDKQGQRGCTRETVRESFDKITASHLALFTGRALGDYNEYQRFIYPGRGPRNQQKNSKRQRNS